jgi:tRNA threonylcarbamoyladenosine biosynthesis protein TsaB
LNILAIETAFEACSVALSVDGETRERYGIAPRGHAERVLPWVDGLLQEAGIRLNALGCIACSRGPGSFTSLRIGISVVQGLAWGAGLPVVPLSSLRITAQSAPAGDDRRVMVAMDARMGEVFCGLFAPDGNGVMQAAGPEQVCAPEQAAALIGDGMAGVGNAFERYARLAATSSRLTAVHADVWPRARAMLPLAADWLRSNDPVPARDAQPVYLRDRVAEKSPG